jgi:RNA polymerase sigma factor (sigma-70 family)
MEFKSIEERNKMVTENRGLVFKVVSVCFSGWSKTYKEDFVGAGSIGLIKAVDTYDETRGQFPTWAWNCIKGEIIRFLKAQKRFRAKVDTKEYRTEYTDMECTVESTADDDGKERENTLFRTESFESKLVDSVDKRGQVGKLKRAMLPAGLTDREITVIRERLNGLSNEEITALNLCGVTDLKTVRGLEEMAGKKLRRYFACGQQFGQVL